MKILMSLCNEWLNDNLDKVLYLTPDYDETLLTNVDVTASTDITVSNCLFSYPSCSKRMLGLITQPESTKLKSKIMA